MPQVTNLSYHESHARERFVPHFVINIDVFSEAQQYNTFFNRKLYIAANGDIRNAIEAERVYGNSNSIDQFEDLEAIVNSTVFRELGSRCKDAIDICRACEFRYMCIDNRLPLQRPDGSLYYEEECAYNPYIAKWFGEDNYVGLEASGISLSAAGFELNAERAAATAERVWAG